MGLIQAMTNAAVASCSTAAKAVEASCDASTQFALQALKVPGNVVVETAEATELVGRGAVYAIREAGENFTGCILDTTFDSLNVAMTLESELMGAAGGAAGAAASAGGGLSSAQIAAMSNVSRS